MTRVTNKEDKKNLKVTLDNINDKINNNKKETDYEMTIAGNQKNYDQDPYPSCPTYH